VILLPDEEGYVAFVPLFPGCTTEGDTPRQALKNAREALELLLDEPTEDDVENLELSYVDHVIVGEIEVEVPTKTKAKATA
jgi:predicted RNase H-like HicB family nuclease